jgi:hypothetical protein
MSLGEYLSVPFLITLGITLLLVGIVGVFFTQRLQEQNHKINSMVGLVSTMAEEVNYLRSRLIQIGGVPAPTADSGMQNYSLFDSDTNKLIEVSDGEEDEDDESSESGSDDDDSESESGSDNESEANADNSANIKVINIHESSAPETFAEDLNDSESDGESDDSKSESSESNESINLVEIDSSNDLDALNISLGNSDDKHINVDLSITDYKKLSLNKLRSIVQEKGLSDDANKLKKPELLKLLGSA